MTAWTSEELDKAGDAEELQLATRRPDGTLRNHVTIWVIRHGDDLYIRSYRGPGGSWYQRVAGQYRQVPVGDDGAVVGAAGAAVGGVQVLDQLGAGLPERDGPGPGVAVGVAGVGEDVAGRDAVAGHRGQHRDQGAGRVGVAG